MASTDDPKTSPTLLRRLRDWRDAPAWLDFVRRYQPLILGWCRAAGLDAEAADEVLDRVLYRLALRMRSFVYDPSRSFRGWLRRLVLRQIIDDWRARHRTEGGEAVRERLDLIPDPADRDDIDDGPHPLLERGERVQAAVRARVGAGTWSLFWLADVEGVPLPEVARRLGKSYAAAFMARKRVRALLRAEGRKDLDERDGPDDRAPRPDP